MPLAKPCVIGRSRAAMETNCNKLIAPGLIDSALKLRLLLLFHQHHRLWGGLRRWSEWLCEGPWAIEEALKSMAEAGFLIKMADQQGMSYQLDDHTQPLVQQLVVCYDDPQRRDDIYTQVREASWERQFREWMAVEQRSVGVA